MHRQTDRQTDRQTVSRTDTCHMRSRIRATDSNKTDVQTDRQTAVTNMCPSVSATCSRETHAHVYRQTERGECCYIYALQAQSSHHFISQALKGVHSEAWNPVFAQQDASAELLCSFGHLGVCQAPWGGESPTLHPTQTAPHGL